MRPGIGREGATHFSGTPENRLAPVAVEQPLELDYRDFANLDASPYFASLREDPSFNEIIQRYRD